MAFSYQPQPLGAAVAPARRTNTAAELLFSASGNPYAQNLQNVAQQMAGPSKWFSQQPTPTETINRATDRALGELGDSTRTVGNILGTLPGLQAGLAGSMAGLATGLPPLPEPVRLGGGLPARTPAPAPTLGVVDPQWGQRPPGPSIDPIRPGDPRWRGATPPADGGAQTGGAPTWSAGGVSGVNPDPQTRELVSQIQALAGGELASGARLSPEMLGQVSQTIRARQNAALGPAAMGSTGAALEEGRLTAAAAQNLLDRRLGNAGAAAQLGLGAQNQWFQQSLAAANFDLQRASEAFRQQMQAAGFTADEAEREFRRMLASAQFQDDAAARAFQLALATQGQLFGQGAGLLGAAGQLEAGRQGSVGALEGARLAALQAILAGEYGLANAPAALGAAGGGVTMRSGGGNAAPRTVALGPNSGIDPATGLPWGQLTPAQAYVAQGRR